MTKNLIGAGATVYISPIHFHQVKAVMIHASQIPIPIGMAARSRSFDL
jgi:hypothetical protein